MYAVGLGVRVTVGRCVVDGMRERSTTSVGASDCDGIGACVDDGRFVPANAWSSDGAWLGRVDGASVGAGSGLRVGSTVGRGRGAFVGSKQNRDGA